MSNRSDHRTATLVIIDAQRVFDDPAWGPRSNPDAERNIARLLAAWRAKGSPVVHFQHSSAAPSGRFRPERADFAFKTEAMPLEGEHVFRKSANSGFIGTGFEPWLRERHIAGLVVAGFTTEHCVSTTVRMGGNLGFDVWVAGDACASFAQRARDGSVIDAATVHEVSLATVDREFATVLATSDLASS